MPLFCKGNCRIRYVKGVVSCHCSVCLDIQATASFQAPFFAHITLVSKKNRQTRFLFLFSPTFTPSLLARQHRAVYAIANAISYILGATGRLGTCGTDDGKLLQAFVGEEVRRVGPALAATAANRRRTRARGDGRGGLSDGCRIRRPFGGTSSDERWAGPSYGELDKANDEQDGLESHNLEDKGLRITSLSRDKPGQVRKGRRCKYEEGKKKNKESNGS